MSCLLLNQLAYCMQTKLDFFFFKKTQDRLVSDCDITRSFEPTVFYKHGCLECPTVLRTRQESLSCQLRLTKLLPYYFELNAP